MIPDFYKHANIRVKHYVHSRTEFDEANTLATQKTIALLRQEDDTASQQTGYQLEGDDATAPSRDRLYSRRIRRRDARLG